MCGGAYAACDTVRLERLLIGSRLHALAVAPMYPEFTEVFMHIIFDCNGVRPRRSLPTNSPELGFSSFVRQFLRSYSSCAVLVLCLVFSGCSGRHEHEKDRARLPVVHPLRRDTTIVRDYVCQVRASQHIELKALERGYVEGIHVDEGQTLQAGQLMFEIMPRINQAELKKAEAEAQFREIEYQNTQRLTNTKITAPSELALAKANLDKAKAELSLAQVHLDFTQVKAPFNGIMGRFKVRKGSLVEEGEILTTLSDNHEMWVYFNVPEAEYLQYRRHALKDQKLQVRLQMADNSFYPLLGEVTAIEADFNNETGNIAFRATFSNPDRILRHGQTGKILVETTIKDALLLPQKTVFEALDKRFVIRMNNEGKVERHEVKVGAQLPDVVVISEGLSEGDSILLEGHGKIHEGDEIDPYVEDNQKVIDNLKVYAE